MTKEIAQKSVDLALQSPNKYLSFEFQGGEPLENFEVLKYIVEYTESHSGNRIIEFNLVSNLTLLNDEMVCFLKEHHVNISTSLDGHEQLQNINRQSHLVMVTLFGKKIAVKFSKKREKMRCDPNNHKNFLAIL
jgi:sulfatase maturation enzyme AslB (radical SAM superfamily)